MVDGYGLTYCATFAVKEHLTLEGAKLVGEVQQF